MLLAYLYGWTTYLFTLASQSGFSDSKVIACNKKILTTSFGGDSIGERYSTSTLVKSPRDESEALGMLHAWPLKLLYVYV